MRVLVPPVRWARDYFRPERVHMRETCDGLPRAIDTDYGRMGVGVCGAWLDDMAVHDAMFESATVHKCALCGAIADQLGGLI